MEITLNENRKTHRRFQNDTYCVLNKDQDLTFKVFEMSPHGFSFIVNKKGMKFFPGSVFKEIILRNENGIRLIQAENSTIAHITDFDINSVRIGVRYGIIKYDRTFFGKKIRSSRWQMTGSNLIKCILKSENSSKEYSGHALDYAANAIKIKLDSDINFNEKDILHLKASLNGDQKIVYEGRCEIIRKENPQIPIVRLTEHLLNTNEIQNYNVISTLSVNINKELEILNEYLTVKDEYKALVLDWRTYLSRLKEILDKEDEKEIFKNRDTRILFLQSIEKKIFIEMNKFVLRLNSIMVKVDEKEHEAYSKFIYNNIGPLFRFAPQGVRIKDKINGYAGDYEMIKGFFDDPYEGNTLFGRLFNKWICEMDSSKGHMNRISFIYDFIIDKYTHSNTTPFTILTLGSGPAIEISKLIENFEFKRKCQISLLDRDAVGLVDFANRVQYLQKPNLSFDLINGDLIHIITKKNSELESLDQYDLTYCAGLLDYFNDKRSLKIVDFLIRHTKPGGYFLYTNLHESNSLRYFMKLLGDWDIYHKSTKTIQSYTPEGHQIFTYIDPSGTNVIVYGIKNA